jgi:ABC-type sugar transport system permease subunit
MLELWNNLFETMGLAEALAIVIVIVVVGAGVITLAQGRRR